MILVLASLVDETAVAFAHSFADATAVSVVNTRCVAAGITRRAARRKRKKRSGDRSAAISYVRRKESHQEVEQFEFTGSPALWLSAGRWIVLSIHGWKSRRLA